jgi:putative ABC transport system ATP-binding protein
MRESGEMGARIEPAAISNPAAEPVVRAETLHKTYRLRGREVHALRGVDLAIALGEFVAIMGPSGCGKSTLLNLLGGLDEPTSGAVYTLGRRLSSLNEHARALLRRTEIGFVFQSYDLLPYLTAQENVEFPLAVAGVKPAQRQTIAIQLLTAVELDHKVDALPDELSGGQKQRVAIARTLATQPRVIFADEPTGSLDSLTGSEIIALLRRAVVEYGTTVVMVTHDPEDAGKADRIIHLRDGRLAETVGGMPA